MSAVRTQVFDCQICGRPVPHGQHHSVALGLDRKKDRLMVCYSCHDLIYGYNDGD